MVVAAAADPWNVITSTGESSIPASVGSRNAAGFSGGMKVSPVTLSCRSGDTTRSFCAAALDPYRMACIHALELSGNARTPSESPGNAASAVGNACAPAPVENAATVSTACPIGLGARLVFGHAAGELRRPGDVGFQIAACGQAVADILDEREQPAKNGFDLPLSGLT